jgi:hypothetical protein
MKRGAYVTLNRILGHGSRGEKRCKSFKTEKGLEP